MKRLLTALVIAGVLLAGCATAKAPETKATAAPSGTPAYLLAAADFTLALEVGDVATLTSLIAPTDDVVSREIATIEGQPIDATRVKRSWNGSLLTTTYEDVTILTLGEVTKVVSGVKGADTMPLVLVEVDGRWRVDTVNGHPAYFRVLSTTPSGRQCNESMQAILIAAYEKQWASDTPNFPKTVQELVPEYLPTMPVCASGGTYVFEIDEPVCSVHGGSFNDINGP